MWDGGLEDVQHAVTCLVPGLRGEFLSVQDDHVLQAVGAWTGKLLVICIRTDEEEEAEEEGETREGSIKKGKLHWLIKSTEISAFLSIFQQTTQKY